MVSIDVENAIRLHAVLSIIPVVTSVAYQLPCQEM